MVTGDRRVEEVDRAAAVLGDTAAIGACAFRGVAGDCAVLDRDPRRWRIGPAAAAVFDDPATGRERVSLRVVAGQRRAYELELAAAVFGRSAAALGGVACERAVLDVDDERAAAYLSDATSLTGARHRVASGVVRKYDFLQRDVAVGPHSAAVRREEPRGRRIRDVPAAYRHPADRHVSGAGHVDVEDTVPERPRVDDRASRPCAVDRPPVAHVEIAGGGDVLARARARELVRPCRNIDRVGARVCVRRHHSLAQ